MRRRTFALLVLVVMAFGTCGPPSSGAGGSGDGFVLRVGYFANVTHASAIVGIEKGFFANALASNARGEFSIFAAGPTTIEALLTGAIDAAYVGPNPAINGFVRSNGEALRIISGATSGGARLVVRQEIQGAADLIGKKLATPQLGNTQDVALRAWLASQGLETDLRGGGDVSILPQPNAQSLEAFAAGEIDGGWLPEPWATRLILEAGAHVLVDERDLWPDGQFVTTLVIASRTLIESRPEVVRSLLAGQVDANAFLRAEPAESMRIVNSAMAEVSGVALSQEVLAESWTHVEFTNDPIAGSLTKSVADAEKFGLLPRTDIRGIFELGPLNEVLHARNEPGIVQP